MKGLTLLEVLIGLSILLIISAVVIFAFSGFRDERNLNSGVEKVASLINEARSKTLASKKSLQYGVHFEADRAILFGGASFSETDPANKELMLPNAVEISSIALNGGGSDLIFNKLTGETNQCGSITIRLKNNHSNLKIISIESTGAVNVQF